MPKVLDRPEFEQVQQRFEAWWAGSSIGGRPLLAPVQISREGAPPEPLYDTPREVRERDPRIQVHYISWGLDAFHLGGDTVPSAVPFYASDMMLPAALVGAGAEYSPRTTWVQPMPDVFERSLPEFSCEHEVIRMLQGHLRALAAALGDRALLGAPAMLDSLTTLSMLREPENLCMDLLDRPAGRQTRRRAPGPDGHRHPPGLLADPHRTGPRPERHLGRHLRPRQGRDGDVRFCRDALAGDVRGVRPARRCDE